MFINSEEYLILCILIILTSLCFTVNTSSVNSSTSAQIVNTYYSVSKYINFQKTPDETARASENIIIHNIEQSSTNNSNTIS